MGNWLLNKLLRTHDAQTKCAILTVA